MPRKIDYADRGDMIMDAVRRVVLRGGLPALTVRAVAAEVEMSPSSILHQFDDKSRLLRVAAVSAGRTRLRAIEGGARRSGLGALLPSDREQLDRDRVWLAFVELARSEPDVAQVVGHHRAEERRILGRIADLGPDDPAVLALAAVIEGLVSAMVTSASPLALDQAERSAATSGWRGWRRRWSRGGVAP